VRLLGKLRAPCVCRCPGVSEGVCMCAPWRMYQLIIYLVGLRLITRMMASRHARQCGQILQGESTLAPRKVAGKGRVLSQLAAGQAHG
jgi:hypothetical protein